jgi:hypothetical protein
MVKGTIADHGLAVMLQREEGSGISSELVTDVGGRCILQKLHGEQLPRTC